jgi:TonB family protein
MKTVIIFVLSFTSLSVYAQTPDAEENKAKPSWADEMPERIDAPDMDIGIDSGLEGMGMDRSALFDDDDVDDVSDDSDAQEEDSLEDDSAEAEQKRLAETQQLADQKKLEEQKLAEQKIIEQELAQQKQIEEEKLAEQKRIEEQQKLVEQQSLEQLRIEAQKSEETQNQAQQQIEQPQEVPATEVIIEVADPANDTTTQFVQYNWKKTKNILPKYPIKAVKNSLEGWVLISIEISSDGKVVNAKVINSFRNRKIFNNAALEAVRKWEFVPPSDFGLTSNQSKDIRIVFNL